MESGSGSGLINPWSVALFQTLQTVEPRAASEQSAYDTWLSQTSAREEARRDRVHAAEGIVPLPVWIVLFFSAALIFVYLLFFADSGESAVVQGMMAGTVTAVVVATLLVLAALNHPFQTGHRRTSSRRDGALARRPRSGSHHPGYRCADPLR